MEINKGENYVYYQQLRQRIETITTRFREIGGQVAEVTIGEPASIDQITQVETELGVKLPISFKQVLTEFSSDFSIRCFLPDNMKKPEAFIQIFSVCPSWKLKDLVRLEGEREEWIKNVFPNPEDPYDAVWYNKLVFHGVGDGDLLAFDLSTGDIDPPIVYLCHDGSPGHGHKMADNFLDLLDKWSRVGFIGSDYFQWQTFTTSSESGIQPDVENAKKFREWLKLEI